MSEMMTVLHLETGHIVAAVSGVAEDSTVEDLVGDDGLSVALGTGRIRVRIPTNALEVTQLPFDARVLDGQGIFRVLDESVVTVSDNLPTALTPPFAELTVGEIGVVIFATMNGPVVERLEVPASKQLLPLTIVPPVGATAELIALPGDLLGIEATP